jgi:hypothetical protein
MPGAPARPSSAHAVVEARRSWLLEGLGRPREMIGVGATPLPEPRAQHLKREAEELYWNELAWEQATDEELVAGGRLTEMAFPAFLAFVDGLLPHDAAAGNPHPDVVGEILLFLADHYLRFTAELEAGADSQRIVWARAMTGRLIDLVLYRLYQLSSEECETLEGAA